MRPPVTAGGIVFLNVPESLAEDIRRLHGDGDGDDQENFVVDPAIPLPVELDPGEAGRGEAGRGEAGRGEAGIDPDDLSWEKILAGMIRVVQDDPRDRPEVHPRWIDYYRRFVKTVKPEIYREFSLAALVKARNGDFDKALEVLRALDGLFPGDAGLALTRALVLDDRAGDGGVGDDDRAGAAFAEAAAAYDRALAAPEPPPAALFNAGFFHARFRDFARARDLLTAYLPVAEDGERRKRAAGALRDIETRGLADEPFQEAASLMRAGDAAGALPLIRAFIERRPQVWNGWFVLGWALRTLGRYEPALEALRKAAELGGGNADTRNETAICLMETGDLNGARRELEAALREDPERVTVIANLGVLALRAGDKDRAEAFFRAVHELDPHDPMGRP